MPSDADADLFRGADYFHIDEEISDTISTTKHQIFWVETPGEYEFLDGYGDLGIDTAHTIKHEISHTLELWHQEDGIPYLDSLLDPYDEDYDWEDTIMSYNTDTLVENDLFPLFTDLDIEALQFVWGTEKATTSTSTSNSTSTGGMATSTQLQQLYIAYFSRPCDPAGLAYWTAKGISTSAFAANMYLQPEFKNANGNLSVESQVNQIYLNLFNRNGDAAGLRYWASQIEKRVLQLASIANDLIYAVQNNAGGPGDALTLANKTNATVDYTPKVSTSTSSILAYQAQSNSPCIPGNSLTEAKNYISEIGQYNPHTSWGINNSIAQFSKSSSSSFKLSSDTKTSNTDAITGLEIHPAEKNTFENTLSAINATASNIFDDHLLEDGNGQEFVSRLY